VDGGGFGQVNGPTADVQAVDLGMSCSSGGTDLRWVFYSFCIARVRSRVGVL